MKEIEERKEQLEHDKEAAILLLCRAVSRLFISKLIKEKLSNKKDTSNS